MRLVPKPNKRLCVTYNASSRLAKDVRINPVPPIIEPHRHVNGTDMKSLSFADKTAQKNIEADARDPTQAKKRKKLAYNRMSKHNPFITTKMNILK